MTLPDESQNLLPVRDIEQQRKEEAVLNLLDGPAQCSDRVPTDDFLEGCAGLGGETAVPALKGLPDLPPRTEAPEVADAVLQDEEAALEIEFADHPQNQPRIVRRACPLEHVEQLFAAHGQRVMMDGIKGYMRGEVGELRPGAGIGMGAHDDRHRGGVEMEERVDAGAPRGDRNRGSRLKQAGFPQHQIPETEMGRDGMLLHEVEP